LRSRFPANQSVNIFVSTTLIIAAPAPATSRPVICNGHDGANAISTPPASMRASAPGTVALVAEPLTEGATGQCQCNSRGMVKADQDADVSNAESKFA
jgi:hypothetical protein